MRGRRLKIVSVVTTTLYIILITLLSLVQFSDEIEPPQIEYFDKFVHFCFYLGLNSLLLYTLLLFKRRLSLSVLVLSTLLSILYSIAIELLQPLMGRTCDVADVVANSVGAVMGAIVVFVLWSKRFLRWAVDGE
ncbi:MAG: VanZ family protein [Rikenellaceae bacterium]